MNIKEKLFRLLTMMVLLLGCYGCQKKDEIKLSTEKAILKINMKSTIFEDEHNLNVRAMNTDPDIQVQQVKYNEKFVLEAELSKATNVTTSALRAQSTEVLSQNVRYKLLVFDEQGKFVTDRSYKYGSEETTQQLELVGGKTYTFIAYSVNSTTALPEYSYSPITGQLESLQLSLLSGSEDLMYFRKDMKVSGNGINYLDIVLKHLCSQVTVVVDSNPIDMNITEMNAVSLASKRKSSIMKISTGVISGGFADNNNVVSFSINQLNSKLITSNPLLYYPWNNNSNYATTLNIGSIKVENNTQTNLSFSGFSILPGNRYKLILTLKPNNQDAVGLYLGRPVVKIAGKVWARHNLGVLTQIDPDKQARDNNTLGGDQFTWGYKTRIAHTSHTDGIPDYINLLINKVEKTSWNLNEGISETALKNTVNDPCPTGFRVPTAMEFKDLIAATNKSTMGKFDGLTTSRLILTSKTNTDAILTFPASGKRNNMPVDGLLNKLRMNEFGFYQTSTPNITGGKETFVTTFIINMLVGESVPQTMLNIDGKNFGKSIRCIAEKSGYIKLDQ